MSLHIAWTEPQYEVFRVALGEKFCFRCRQRRDFAHVRTASVEPSYYGPIDTIVCETCGTEDSDLFPGRWREWGE